MIYIFGSGLLNILNFNLYTGINESSGNFLGYSKSSALAERRADLLLPETSPTAAPQPFLPLMAPSPLTPFTNSTIPKLSGCLSHLRYSEKAH